MEKTLRYREYSHSIGDEINTVDVLDADPILARIYAARGITSSEALQRRLQDLIPYDTLLGMPAAVALLYSALQQQKQIIVIGDFDADGATSTALAVHALKTLGAENVQYLVPNRFAYGYGLTPSIVEAAHAMGAELIITVDNGITSIDGVAAAKALGISVLVTDHHLPGEELPAADAMVNPNQPNDVSELKCLAGIGVIYYVMIALRAHLQTQGWFEAQKITPPNMADYLDLVALGTIADVVPLDRNNRILVQQGLLRMRAGKIRPGIAALCSVSNINPRYLQSRDLGFSLGPRLNAAGRLDDMSRGIACLLADNIQSALPLAQLLQDLNQERQVLDQQMQMRAMQQVDQLMLVHQKNVPLGLCLFEADFHQGIIGIVAGRVKERYHRPTIVFARVAPGELKGSGRSIIGVHLRDVLQCVSARYPLMLTKFGGHAMAAGLSLAESDLSVFQKAFEEVLLEFADPLLWQQTLWVDVDLPSTHLTLAFAKRLMDAGPWGAQFPEPLFRGRFTIVRQRLVGQRHLQLLLQLPDETRCVDAIAFQVNTDQWPNHHCTEIDIVYRLNVEYFNGLERLKLVVEHIKK